MKWDEVMSDKNCRGRVLDEAKHVITEERQAVELVAVRARPSRLHEERRPSGDGRGYDDDALEGGSGSEGV